VSTNPNGTCYEDAWRFLIREEEGELVHGSVQTRGLDMATANPVIEEGLAQEIAKYLVAKRQPDKVESGDYDEIYRKESGTASKFRKKVQSMIGELKGDKDCPGCDEMRQTISSFGEEKKGKGRSIVNGR